MTIWVNNDGLQVRFDRDKAAKVVGGAVSKSDKHLIEFVVDYAQVLTATPTILTPESGAYGVVVPKGLRVEAVEVIAESAFTSSGTIGTSTFVLGLKKMSDRSTELDHDGLLAAGFVGSRIDAAGERTYVEIGTTGVGALVGTTIAENGVIVVSNSQHASHPYTAGRARVRIVGYYPNATS